MPTIPVIERDIDLFYELKHTPCNIGSALYRQKVLDFHFINDFVNTDNAALGNGMILAFPNSNQYNDVSILRSDLEIMLSTLDCDRNYININFDEITHQTSYSIEETTNKETVAKYRLNIFFSLFINYPDLTSVQFKPGLCRYNESVTPVQKVGVIIAHFSQGKASEYYDISIPPNE